MNASAAGSNVVPLKPKGILTPPPTDPLGIAEALVETFWTHARTGLRTLQRWRDSWWLWSGERGHWIEITDEEMDNLITRALSGMDSSHGPCAWEKSVTGGVPTRIPWRPKPSDAANIRASLQTVVALGSDVERGDWLSGDSPLHPIAFKGSWIRFDPEFVGDFGEQWRPADSTPAWFNLSALQVPYDPSAVDPVLWLEFLHQIFDGDQQAIACLQEWFGYLLSGRTHLQSALQLLGPTRSGKGVVMRVLEALYGGSVATTSLSSLFGSFGLQGALHAPVLAIQDAKGGRGGKGADAVERLLGIIGGDPVTVDRKYKAELNGVHLPCRVMIVGNDVLALPDTAGALAARFVFVQTQVSFRGREDRFLADRLCSLSSLQGIVLWGLAGLDRLEANGWRFTVQEAAQARAEEFASLGSPLARFLDDELTEMAGGLMLFDDAYSLYTQWCREQSIKPLAKDKFQADLNALRRGTVTRPRVAAGDPRPWMLNGYVGPKYSVDES